MRAAAVLLLVAMAMAGCRSYSWRAKVPVAYRSVSVPTFRNETNFPAVSSALTRQVLREFQREGTFQIGGADAPVEVQGTLTAVAVKGSGSKRIYYSRIAAARVLLVAKISVIDRTRGKVLLDNRVYSAESSYVDETDMTAAKDLAIERAADDLARSIVDDLTLFNWEDEAK